MTKNNSSARSFSGKYSSERQAFYYELAKKEGINTENRDVMKDFILQKNKEIFDIIEKNGVKKEKGYYLKVVEELRKKYDLPKYFPLDFLQKIVNFESNKKAFEELNISYDDLLKLPKNKIIQNDEIEKIKIPRIDDLIEAQTDNDYGFLIEWVANAIDASTPGESIGRFGEGFLQSLEKIDIPGSKIVVSTKSVESKTGYNIYLKKVNGELKFGSLENSKTESGTSVKIEKQFSDEQIRKISDFLYSKLKTNTKANIILNGEKINNLGEYKYINGVKLDLSDIPTIELKLTQNGFEVIDNGKGMTENVVVKKLLRPNSTGNERKVLSDDEVVEISKKETRFFYKQKNKAEEKTTINLNISGINIESFEASTIGNIADFTLEFPSSSPLKDSRNEIDLSREVSYAMGLVLEKIENKSSDLREKLDLLEISSIIYEKLKNRPTNIVDEKFVLGTIMKNNFKDIRKNLEENGISVLPANKALIEVLGLQKDIFYINEEFIDFDIDAIKNKTEIKNIEAADLKGSLIGEKYKFYELEFSKDASYDYLVFQGNVFINSKLFFGKTKNQKDKIINILNTSINLNTSYEVDSQKNYYGRILTSGEDFVVEESNEIEFKQANGNKSNANQRINIANSKKVISNSEITDSRKELQRKYDNLKQFILKDFDNLRKKYGNKIERFGRFGGNLDNILFEEAFMILYENPNNLDYLFENGKDYKKIRENIILKLKINFLFGLDDDIVEINEDESDYYKNYFSLIVYILDNKSEKITKPYINFIKRLYGSDELKLKQIQTLNKIIDSDSKSAIELMERFEETNMWNIFRDFDILEKKIEGEENSKDSDGSYILALDRGMGIGEFSKFIPNNNLRKYFEGLHFVKENLLTDKAKYFDFKKEFVKKYNGNNGDNESILNILKKEFNIENVDVRILGTLDYYFKIEDEIIKNNEIKDYKEGLLKKFVLGDFSDYYEFIEEFKEQYYIYKHTIDGLNKKFAELYSQKSDFEIKELEKKHNEEVGILKNRTFGELFEKFNISGRGIYPMIFEQFFNFKTLNDSDFYSINDKYLKLFEKFQHYNIFDLKQDYFEFRFKKEEFLDEDNSIIDEKIDEFLELRNEYYSKIENKYGIDEVDFEEFEDFLDAEYVLAKNFYDLEFEEKKYLESKGMEYRIDETDSIFDEKFSFILDIIKGLDESQSYSNYDYDSDIWREKYYNYEEYSELFEEIFGDNLVMGLYDSVEYLKTEDGKQKQRELFEALMKNPEYKYLFLKPKIKNLDIFTELSKKYPQDLVTFLQFLKSGGEFLKNRDLSVEHFEENMEIKCSDLIGITFAKQEEIEENNNLKFLEETKNLHLNSGIDYSINRDIIAGVNIAQDSVGMLNLKEGPQNSIDAIKKYNKENPQRKVEKKINIDFYSENNHFVSSISDPVGMDLKTIIVKLLVPYNSGKDAMDSGVGQFGKGFFTFAPNSKQIRIKTSVGNGKVYYLELNPIKIKGVISDFDIRISEKKEEFKGTIIERIDEAEGISGNLRAMIGVNLLKKYVGNVRDVDIEYNGSILNDRREIKTISVSKNIVGKNKIGELENLGNLELLKNKDNISRFTKNDLWISEIKDDLLSDLPDWMQEFFMENNLTINIPDKIPLIGSRNSLVKRKYYIDLLKPYFYKQVVDFVLKSYVGRDFRIPMMPEDYLMMTRYDFNHSREILDLAERFNNNDKIDFSESEIEFLKDKEKMREFLVLCNFEFKGKITSLYEIKQDLHNDELKRREKLEGFGEIFEKKMSQAVDYKEKLKNNTPEYNLSIDEIEEKTGIEGKKIKEFISFIYKDFDHLIKKHFGGYFEITFYSGNTGIANNFSNNGSGMAFNISTSEFKKLVLDYKNPKVYENLIDIVTHEMTHNLEGDKWGTHETDEQHPKSFMKIHRGLLRDFVRN